MNSRLSSGRSRRRRRRRREFEELACARVFRPICSALVVIGDV
jgi:hypothetical protein